MPIFDPLYLIFWLPALALALGAQFWVKSSFSRYQEVPTRRRITGAQAARSILDSNGLHNVKIEIAQGFLGDHYDPSSKIIRLSDEVYSRATIASVSVAAHEVGHAIQDAKGYHAMRVRSQLVPLATIGSNLAIPLLFIGMWIQAAGLMKLGVLLFSAAVLFQVVTLPVEFNASSRALLALENAGILDRDETPGAKAVLTAAAMTYVAAAVSAIMQLIYFAIRSGLLGGSRDE